MHVLFMYNVIYICSKENFCVVSCIYFVYFELISYASCQNVSMSCLMDVYKLNIYFDEHLLYIHQLG